MIYAVPDPDIQAHGGGRGGEADDSAIIAIVELVERLKTKYPAPAKIIVYSQKIEEAEKLSEALGTMLY